MISLLLFFSCTTSSQTSKEVPIDSSSPIVKEVETQPEDDSGMEQESETNDVYISTKTATETISYEYDQNQTLGNPLQGFVTNYGWGEPNNAFPHSMEFRYIPLSALLSAPQTYTYDIGLEPFLEEAKQRGHQVIARVYIDYPALENGLPSFLQGEVPCENYTDYGGGCSPEYSNALLQSTILEFIANFGETYDGDKRIAFVQIGLLGFWGEWHTYPYTEWFADDIFQQEVITAFDLAFDMTPIQLRLPYQDSPQREIGFHDDSFAYSTTGDVPWFFWSKMTDAQTTTRWESEPMGGEIYPPLQSILFTEEYVEGTYQQNFSETVQTTHMTYLLNYQVFCMNGVGYGGTQFEIAQQEALNMGYEFTLERAVFHLSEIRDDRVYVQLEIHLRNSGNAPFYYPLKLSISKKNHGEQLAIFTDVETLLPSEENMVYTTEIFDLPISEFLNGYEIQLLSDHILEQAHISWANEGQSEGSIEMTYTTRCISEEGSYAIGQEIQKEEHPCVCDVDGNFYTINNEICD